MEIAVIILLGIAIFSMLMSIKYQIKATKYLREALSLQEKDEK